MKYSIENKNFISKPGRYLIPGLLSFLLVACDAPYDQARIYKPEREIFFLAEHIDRDGNLVCTDTIRLYIPEPGLLRLHSRLTGQITHDYDYLGPCSEKTGSTTGLKENNNQMWLHPPRKGNMIVTELGAFPKMYLPPKIGASGKGVLVITSGYDEWNGLRIHYRDSVTKIIDTTIAGIAYDSVAFREGQTLETPIGPVHTRHAFHQSYGWIYGEWKMDTATIKMSAFRFNW